MKNLVCLSLVLVVSKFAYGFDAKTSIAAAAQACKWSSLQSDDVQEGVVTDARTGGYEGYGCDKGNIIKTGSGTTYQFDVCGDYDSETADSVWVKAATPATDSTSAKETLFFYVFHRTGEFSCKDSSL